MVLAVESALRKLYVMTDRTWPIPEHPWVMRMTLLGCGLTENLKWKMPCYTFEGRNIVLISASKEYAAISFVKVALLSDAWGILEKPGENCQSVRLIRFTTYEAINGP